MRKVGCYYKQKSCESLFYLFCFASVLRNRCETKRKHATNFVFCFAKRSENHVKQFAFRFHFAYKLKRATLYETIHCRSDFVKHNPRNTLYPPMELGVLESKHPGSLEIICSSGNLHFFGFF
jgi:hypothetical protein